jgi:hypothetical protein
MSTAMLRMHQMYQTTQDQTKNHQVNIVSHGCETCGGPHLYYECPATGAFSKENVYAANTGNNGYPPQGDRNILSYRSTNFLGPPGFEQPNQVNQNHNVQNRNNQGNQNQSRTNNGFQNQNQGFNENRGFQGNYNQGPTQGNFQNQGNYGNPENFQNTNHGNFQNRGQNFNNNQNQGVIQNPSPTDDLIKQLLQNQQAFMAKQE